MSSNLLVALIVLPLMGALIAWAGDVIGYRLGKTRRTILGLRPRTTARVVGALVGGVLPLAGVGFAMVASQDARDALLHIRQLRQEAESLEQANAGLSAEIQRAQRQAAEASERAADASARNARAQQLLTDTRAALSFSKGTLAITRARLSATREALASARTALSVARSRIASARGDLDRARADLSKANNDLRKATTGLAKARADLTRAHAELSKTQAELSGAQADLAERQKLLDSTNAYLEYADKATREAEALQEHLHVLEGELAETEQALARYKIASRAIIEEEVAYEPGEEIIRAIVESRLTQEELEGILDQLLSLADAAAARQGIAAGPTGRAVRAISPAPPGLAPGRARESDIVREVANQIRRGDAPTYVVIVRAWGRTFKRQAVEMAVEFWAAPNKVVFSAGEVVFSTTIDGGQPRARVFGELWATVKHIREIAAARGMLPSPRTGQYGEVSAEDLLNALDKILQIGGPATVQCVVVADVRVAQPEDAPMQVRLEIAPGRAP